MPAPSSCTTLRADRDAWLARRLDALDPHDVDAILGAIDALERLFDDRDRGTSTDAGTSTSTSTSTSTGRPEGQGGPTTGRRRR